MENRQRTSIQRWLGAVAGICCLTATLIFTAYINDLPDYTSLLYVSIGQGGAGVIGVLPTEDICVWGVLQKLRWERIYAFVILFLMVSYGFALIVERWLKYSVATRQSRAFLSSVTAALELNRPDLAIGVASLYPESPVALIVDASFQHGRCPGGGMYDCGPSMHARQRAIVFVTEMVKRGLWTLDALRWSVPLVSLFLSLSGVILCLKGMKAAEGTGISAISGGIGEALWPAAFAILATIPIVWSHKCFRSKADAFLMEMDRLSLAVVEEIVERRRAMLHSLPRYVTQELDSRLTSKLAN